MTLGLVHDPVFQEHDPGSYHCESPQRLMAIDASLRRWAGLERTTRLPLRAATEEELTRIHTPQHLARLASCSGRSVAIDMDTHTSQRSFDVALQAAGSLIDLCDEALVGNLDHGIALVRPPGHHATPTRAMGFCLFNNVAVAAAHLVEKRGLERVMIVDWDVHHGNGTEEVFFTDDRVLYFSCHQSPFYPGTGPVDAIGHLAGQGYNLNVPLSGGQGDADYLRVFEDLVAPVARQWRPQFILVSAGFDCHREDPLGGMEVTDLGFGAMTRVLCEVAEESCPGRIVATLEGGYHPPAVGRSVVAVAEALLGNQEADALRQEAAGRSRPGSLQKALAVLSSHWELG